MGIDHLTGTDVVMEDGHNAIHLKKRFSLDLLSSSVAAGATYAVRFRTPGSSYGLMHMRFLNGFAYTNLSQIKLYEKMTSTVGTARYPYNHFRLRESDGTNRIDNSGILFYYGATTPTIADGRTLLGATAGGGFTNQPANDGVEVVSNSASDVGCQYIIYGTTNGAETTVVKETVTLNGTTAVSTTKTDWGTILGVEHVSTSKKHVGTVTFREASANATITTLAINVLSAGVHTPTDPDCSGLIPLHDASGASTSLVGLIGNDGIYSAAGVAVNELTSTDALNGTTGEDHGTVPMVNVTKVLLGAVAANVNVNINAPYRDIFDTEFGTGGNPGSNNGGDGSPTEERVLAPDTDHTFLITVIGATTASIVKLPITFYFEKYNQP